MQTFYHFASLLIAASVVAASVPNGGAAAQTASTAGDEAGIRETLAAYGCCSPRAAAAARARSAQPHHTEAREARQVPAGTPA